MFVNLPHKRLMQGNGKKVLKIQDDSSEEEGSSGSQQFVVNNGSAGSEVSFIFKNLTTLQRNKKAPKSPAALMPYVLIEGPEPSQDLSYKWV